MTRELKYLIVIYLIICGTSSCSSTSESLWIKTNDNVILWIPTSDTTKLFYWNGKVIDGIPNGNGVLSIIDKNGEKTKFKTNMFYGTSSIENIITMGDGSKYVGAIVDGKMEGFGVLIKPDELYIGYFHESKPNGFLKLYRNDKLYYEGNWKDGTFNGEGTLYKEDGSIKTGNWVAGRLSQTLVDIQLPQGHYYGYVKDGKPEGAGRMAYNDSSFYDGNWNNGSWSGDGKYYTLTDTLAGEWGNGKLNGAGIYKTENFIYEGDWTDNKPDGIGYAASNDSSFYSGEWSEGKRHGYGDMIFSNGDSYFGDWSNNQFDGTGTYTYVQTGDVYYGEWKDGLQNGLGTYTAKGFEYTGNWEEGWINGEGRITYSNNDFYEGNFVENKPYGIGYYEFSNGNSYEGEFIDGKFNGLGIFRFADGNVYEGEFQDGRIKGDGTLYYTEGKDTLAITANWDGSNQFPKLASILFNNGDLYEGELVNGFPTENGIWTTAEEREKGEIDVGNSLSRANEFYKKHRDTWNKAVIYTSTALSIVDVAASVAGTILIATGVGAPVGAALIVTGKVARLANITINAADATVATTSAGIDTYEAISNGEDYTYELTTLGTELAVNTAFAVAPKVLVSAPVRRAAKVILSSSAKAIRTGVSKSIVVLNKNKIFGKIFKITKDKYGTFQKTVSNSSAVQMSKNIISSTKKKFESAFLKSILSKTLIYKKLQAIKAKGPIRLSPKDKINLFTDPKNFLRSCIQAYTGDRKNFQEFFIRLSMGDKQIVKELLELPEIRQYVDRAIRRSGEGGVHEWLMTKNFKDFLTNPKWGEDGEFLALVLTEFVQRTDRILFKEGGSHHHAGSGAFHKKLSLIIEQCSSIEELFVEIKHYAKKELTKDSYDEFLRIFSETFSTN